MSILDGMFKDEQTIRKTSDYAQSIIKEILPHLGDDIKDVIEATIDGSTLADVFGIDKEHLGALLDLGCSLLQAGETRKGIDVLTRLHQFDPLEERAYYALGVAYQTQGELPKAAHFYLQFLALDATNPMGYLRLGECLLAAQEHAEALSAFSVAESLAVDGKGEAGHLEEARRMLAIPEIEAAKAARHQASRGAGKSGSANSLQDDSHEHRYQSH